jgi:hypothetical protein
VQPHIAAVIIMAVSRDKAFEIFVKRAITGIHKEAWGRSREIRELKDACGAFLATLEQHEAGASPAGGPPLAIAVLHPLQLACGSGNAKIMELALGALHKLVAHAWLQGESSTAEELMPDETDVVSRVIKAVIKCGELPSPSLQLSVIRALLTFTTAEHFVAHGDALMTAVRAVFNLALGSDSEDIKRTACNALLQILNTVSKRVTSFSYSACATPATHRGSDADGVGALHTHASVGGQPGAPHTGGSGISLTSSTAAAAAAAAPATPSSVAAAVGETLPAHVLAAQLIAAEGGSGGGAGEPDARTAQLADLAQRHDIRGLEAAIGVGSLDEAAKALATGAPLPEPPTPTSPVSGSAGADAGAGRNTTTTTPPASSGQHATASDGAGSAVRPSALVLPADVGGSGGASASAVTTAPVVHLSGAERDVLLVLTAFCKLASREAGLTEVESYLHQVRRCVASVVCERVRCRNGNRGGVIPAPGQ